LQFFFAFFLRFSFSSLFFWSDRAQNQYWLLEAVFLSLIDVGMMVVAGPPGGASAFMIYLHTLSGDAERPLNDRLT
jgi:hypothetical protein